MIVGGPYGHDIQQIQRLYNTAEADLKNVGRIEHSLIVTGVNQCRYVGQHLLRALVADDDERIRSELDAAKKHAQRAIYDINDSAIQFYIQQIDDLRYRHFPTVDFASVVPDYSDVVATLAKARSLVEITREALEDREKYYQEVRSAVASLREVDGILSEHRPDLVRAVQRENRKKVIAWVGIGVTALAAPLSALIWAASRLL